MHGTTACVVHLLSLNQMSIRVEPFGDVTVEPTQRTVEAVVAALVEQHDAPKCATCVLVTDSGTMAKNKDLVPGKTFILAHLTRLTPVVNPFPIPVTAKRRQVLQTFLYATDKAAFEDFEAAKDAYTVSFKNGTPWSPGDDATLLEKGLPDVVVVQRKMFVKVAGHVFDVCGTTTVGELRDMVAAKLEKPRQEVNFKVPGVGRHELLGKLTAAHMSTTSTMLLLQQLDAKAMAGVKNQAANIIGKGKTLLTTLKRTSKEYAETEAFVRAMSSTLR